MAVLGGEGVESRRQGTMKIVQGAGRGLAQMRFEFGERQFNGVEVGAVRRQVADAPPWGRRIRAALTSGRSCSAARVVFFMAQAELLQPVPQSGDANGNFQLLKTPSLELAQSQIGLRHNPTAQGSVMLLQTGAPITTDLFGPARAGETVLLPKPLHAFAADAKTLAHFAGALPALPRQDDPLPQILTQRPHHPLSIKGDYPGAANASI